MATEGVDAGSDAVTRERTLRERVFARREFGVVLAIIGLLAVGTIVRADVFLTLGNFVGVLRNAAVVALIGYGMTLLITAGEFDLSVGSVMAISAGITAVLLLDGYAIWFAFLVVVLLAVLFGIFQGILVTKFGLPSLIVTIGTLTLLRGGHLFILGNVTQSIPSDQHPMALFALGGTISLPFPVVVPFTDVELFTVPAINYAIPFVHEATQTFNTIPLQIFWVVLLGVLFHYVLFYTAFGYRARATGGKLMAADYTGINTDQVKIAGFVIVALMAAFAGIGQLAFTGNVSPLTGDGQELIVIAAVVIGGTDLFGGEGSIAGTVLGALVFAFTQNILVLAGLGTQLFSIFTGLFIIFAVAVDAITRRSWGEATHEEYVGPIQELIDSPAGYFRVVKEHVQGTDRPLAFLGVTTAIWVLPILVVAVLSFLTNPLTGEPLVGIDFSLFFIGSNPGAIAVVPLFGYLLAGCIAILGVTFVHPFVRAMGGTGGIDETVQAVLYAMAPTALLFVPMLLLALDFIAPVVLGAAAIVFAAALWLLVVGLRVLHEMDRRGAVVAVVGSLLPWAILLYFLSVQL